MEMTVQKYESRVALDGKGGASITSEHAVGKEKSYEFGGSGDEISTVVGGAYLSNWSPDFFQKELGKDQNVSRLYFDKKMAVDIADPSDKISKAKRKLLFKNGFGYLCIPPRFHGELARLYQSAISEYYSYEELHPRPLIVQEVLIPGEGNVPPRRALFRAIDTKVGGGLTHSIELQQQDLNNSIKLSKAEEEAAKERSRVMKAIRKAAEKGQPFRNPFIGKKGSGKRLYNVSYAL